MVVIRLARAGAKDPFYHVVVTEKSNARDGRFIERLGFYNPVARGKDPIHRVNMTRFDYWLSVGAKASDTVAQLIKRIRKEGNSEA